ncbi:hypothetical protein DACRYDRAFT_89632 [Dacryopinax primogenitus]|uniref:Uncharacterized protein n=1 Tax=Dacryopinax primogenitus (strain DJM 731) TaxID=1858805 RepID=M5G454_DACPD|nr:uncharacterized protein DACRYDRAFT_89632 [Dacryopinax primogenitus]EJU00617.1 hypothetical protein DACRYDRAFT_89632 [Dacryopinax primogenitus]
MSSICSVAIISGHGKIGLCLAHLLSPKYTISSIICSSTQFQDILTTGAHLLLLSLEEASMQEFTKAFEDIKVDMVVFSFGAGGKGGLERTKAVDYEGVVKVFDAIAAMEKPVRLLLVSSINSHDCSKPAPSHYVRGNFKWTIVRPGWLINMPGVGMASIGRMGMSTRIVRDDVALMLSLLVEHPNAARLALDIVGGETPLKEALDKAIEACEMNMY